MRFYRARTRPFGVLGFLAALAGCVTAPTPEPPCSDVPVEAEMRLLDGFEYGRAFEALAGAPPAEPVLDGA